MSIEKIYRAASLKRFGDRAKETRYTQFRYKGNGKSAYFEEDGNIARWFTVNSSGNKSYIGKSYMGVFGTLRLHPMVEKTSTTFSSMWEKATNNLKSVSEKVKTSKLFGTKLARHALCNNGKLMFGSVEHAKVFFIKLIHTIDSDPGKLVLLPLYRNLIENRFLYESIDNLCVNLNSIVPRPVFGLDNKGDRVLKNASQILIARAFHKLIISVYMRTAKTYIPKDLMSREDIKNIKSWTPAEQKNFFGLCKKYLSPEKYEGVKTQAVNAEVKIGLMDNIRINYFVDPLNNNDPVAQHVPMARDLRALGIMCTLMVNPVSKMIDIRKHAVAVSPPVDDKDALKAFFKKYNKHLRINPKTGKPNLTFVFIPEMDGGRAVLVKNNHETRKEFKKKAAALKTHASLERWFDSRNMSKMLTTEKYLEGIESNLLYAVIGSKFDDKVKNMLIGIFSYLSSLAGFAEFGVNPLTWIVFAASMQQIAAELPQLAEVFMKGSETDTIRVTCMLGALAYGGSQVVRSIESSLLKPFLRGKYLRMVKKARAREAERQIYKDNLKRPKLPVYKEKI
ncbi:MAG: hypothetical protein ABIH00_07655, partial [Armatimonadota bacterium]